MNEYLLGATEEDIVGTYRFDMGTIWISQRADLSPVYQMIFRRLKNLAPDWGYSFPRLHLIDLSPLRKELEQSKPEEYSPFEAFAKEQEETERQAELEKTRAEFDEVYEQSRREAMDRPPPATVRAYQEVFGREPKGWPIRRRKNCDGKPVANRRSVTGSRVQSVFIRQARPFCPVGNPRTPG